MEYKFATTYSNYADLASGAVFYSLPGHPAFPVRLASEIYQRCLSYRDLEMPCTLFDPCCGAAYHLGIIAYLHWDSVCRVIGSDIDEKAIQLAERNLSLLTPVGMERRNREISAMVHLYGKISHKEALESLLRLQEQVTCLTAVRPMQTQVFRANAADAAALKEGLQGIPVDIVFTDIPYGQHSEWQDIPAENPAWAMLEALRKVLSETSIVAVASDKLQKIAHAAYKRLEKFQVGKRQVTILRPI
jgi:23S rRNA (guanine2535-N1)-methyltransferase